MKKLIILPVLFAVISANAQLTKDSLLIESHYRSFHFVAPAPDTRPTSLLFLMHGSGGMGEDMFTSAAKLQSISAGEKLLIVSPDGYKHFWNECRRFSNAAANTENINENAFFTAMIAYFKKRYGIDEHQVFAAGFSGGGHMAYKFALTMPDKFRAVAAVVANMPDAASLDCGEARKAIPIMIVNGTLDPTNPYNGGEMFVNNASFGVVRSTEQSFEYWARLAGYTGQPVRKILPDTDTSDHKTIESYTFKENKRPEIVLYKVIGGRHDLPKDIDTYLSIWEFFKRQ